MLQQLSRRTYAIAAIVLAAAVFVAVNIAVDASITTAKIDLTDTHRFTLSQGTRNIIKSLEEPVTLRFFFSKETARDYAQTRAYASRVRDLLREYAAVSHGKIILEEIDPQPYTPAEDEASAAGISGVPTETGETVYFGLTGVNRIDGREVIPYFSPEREGLLEYDLTSLIYRLSAPKKYHVAILSGLPLDSGSGGMQAMMQGRARPYAIYQELTQAFAAAMLPPDFTSIPAGTDVLMIVQPGALNDAQTYAIDQYVLKGGRALVFVDPNSELAQGGAMQPGQGAAYSTLPRLFQSWGIFFDTTKEIADLKLAQHVQLSRDGPPMTYPVWLHLTQDQFSDEDPVTANLKAINLGGAGSLKPLKNATTKFTSLIGSTDRAGLIDVAEARMMAMTNPESVATSVSPTGEEYIIAARLTGPAKTAFPHGAPAGVTGTQVTGSNGINVIVMADTDIFKDEFWVRLEQLYGKTVAAPFANNDSFVLGALENLTGSSDLISLRTRATNDRPFLKVREIQTDAERAFKQQEDALKARLADTEQQLKALQSGQAGQGAPSAQAGLSPQQQKAVDTFKRQLSEIRGQLRQVQRDLRQDVDALGDSLAFINIVLVPLLVAGFALVIAWIRRRRRARAIHL